MTAMSRRCHATCLGARWLRASSGMLKQNVLPWPCPADSAHMRPPCAADKAVLSTDRGHRAANRCGPLPERDNRDGRAARARCGSRPMPSSLTAHRRRRLAQRSTDAADGRSASGEYFVAFLTRLVSDLLERVARPTRLSGPVSSAEIIESRDVPVELQPVGDLSRPEQAEIDGPPCGARQRAGLERSGRGRAP